MSSSRSTSPPLAPPSSDALIVGGGIAGLAAAWQLGRAGLRVTVVEREPLPCAHASGRNAAIFRHAEPLTELCRLALRSRALLDEVVGDDSWLERRGALYVAPQAAPVRALKSSAEEAGVVVEHMDAAALVALEPALAGGDAAFGLFSPADGVIDNHAVTQALSREARALGATFTLQAEVARILVEGARVTGVELCDGRRLKAGVVVLAAGAWAADLGLLAGAPLPLAPLRRHLALLEGRSARELDGPIVWRVVDDVYFRKEGGGALASPCDEELSPPCLPKTDPESLALLAAKVASLAPALADATVRRSWACLRTFAPDRNLVVGRDPRVSGLAWLAGLGGHGMTLAAAAAEVLRRELVDGEDVPDTLSPSRLTDTGGAEVLARLHAAR